jgi:Flp pilus assembly protein TadD
MKRIAILCIVGMSVVSLSAWQPPPVKKDADRDRKEALQHYRLGQEALHSEHYDIAEQEFQKSARLDPTLELAPYGLGQVYMATKRFRPAVIAFEKCREVFKANTVAATDDGIAYQRRINDEIKALEDEQQVYQQPGRNASTPIATNYLRQLSLRITAMKDARQRATSGPQPIPAWMSLALGSAYFRTDAAADAEREYRAAIEVDPKLGEAHNNLAVVLLLTGRATDADVEISAAEKSGFKVNPQLKEDVKKALPPR